MTEDWNQRGHPFMSASDSAKKWATHFNCNHNVAVEETEHTILHTYSDCDDNIFIKYLIVKGADIILLGTIHRYGMMSGIFLAHLTKITFHYKI